MSGDYEVGHGKPPKATQFQKGQSGNPKGRPKGVKNLKTDLMAELAESIVMKEGHSTARITKQRALVKRLMAGSLKGDTRQAALLINMIMRVLDPDPAEELAQDMKAEDQAILDAYVRRQNEVLVKKDP